MANPILGKINQLKPLFLTCMIAGTVLAILAPYGTSRFPIPVRFTFWIGLCFAGGMGAGLANQIMRKSKRDVGIWTRAFLQSLGGTAIVTLFLVVLSLLYSNSTSLKQILITTFYVWVISISISVIGALTDRRSAESETVSAPRPALLERLPLHLQNSDIFALSAEDHYVRVITSKGEEMILMRLSDAIKEVAPLEGLSPHRSWWVAKQGVERLVKTSGKNEIRLKSEHQVPVSRNGNKTVKEAGWR